MLNDKYKIMMCDRITETIQNWEQQNTVEEQEIYTFLHNLKGTAGSIGMEGLSEIAATKLEQLEEKSSKRWEKENWKAFLFQIEETVSFFEKNVKRGQTEENDLPFIKRSKQNNFILVIDDDIVFASYIKNILESKGFMVIVAHNGKRGLELIYELNPALVFLDIKLPDINGFSILENINKIKSNHMFVTIMSVDDSKGNRAKAYDLGALDFIKKPLDADILISYVRNRLVFKQALELSIMTDELTQLYNRKYMNTQLEFLMEQFEKRGEQFSIAIADIDFFKNINDTYGHIVGDEVLKGFSNLIMSAKREEDILFRFGGEEFVLVMPNTSKNTAFSIMERLRTIVGKQPFKGNEQSFNITFSSGIAEINHQNKHPKALVEQADQALYKAKTSGRNQTVLFTKEEQISKKQKLKLIVIDDVAIIRNLVTNYFNKLQVPEEFTMEVAAFENGVKFLESNWYEKNTKYIILLDGMMPQMDGMNVLKKIREEYSSNDVIVSMLTGRNDEEYVLEALANGADDFIVKPFNIADVTNRMLQLANQLFLKAR
ncbi:diguanylate cyclase [Solibacillus sp. FSL W7-1472]|uniref:Response regulator containing a CheY-like receiver domain and a GGDEF domain n=1 Tax=Solibacillus silvestris (strain StLB046) TaxID=1002809 RepID=F2F133_SOLSS|nr:diguanylate cyclase [Solibacillus silvestris]OBW59405.1 diguanylate cyclase [Solibacillus silvestris]BAK16828.1 response regulator containing a CheY-like receiver domain and a GGDEF domain [Solibacillus silvestris StLB046]